ncbi:trafficking protein particle complex subunit 5 [Cimex lectularius]|uniref:Trafficking protein particle complex subunit 5 n=1 Tax=Cimex lectularius TaxID=79782 RepID=A0A8I6RX57_CIMLE|nr:trafficking protein particle complex subunit 5 [Cimex lectularius]
MSVNKLFSEKFTLQAATSPIPAAIISQVRPRTSILDRNLSKGKREIGLSTYALLFSEMVQYCQNKVHTVPELQNRLAELGQEVGMKLIDLYCVREAKCKRETKLLNMLLFIKTTLWKGLFLKEIDILEHANDDEKIYYMKEQDPIVNTYISIPKDKRSFNCAVFAAGIMEAFLCGTGFTAKVTAHWHKGTTYMIVFDESVMAKQKLLTDR